MAAHRSNVLIIYPDQWRADTLACAGDVVVHTPHLDQLARQGVRLTHAFTVNPLCTPSRSAFMTGRYPHTTGVMRNNDPLPTDEVCFAEVLSAAGYRTGYIGKWHLDGDPRPGFVPPERRHGWQHWAAFNRGHRYYDGVYFRDTPDEIPTPGFEPDHQTDLAVAFLEEAAADRARPFCLMISWGPPHTPLEPPERHRATYDPQVMPLPASVPPALAERACMERARYDGLVTALDDNVGSLLAALDRLDMAEETIVLFTSDHGDSLGEHGLLRKSIPYDEATRVPCIVRWPGRIPADTVTDHLFACVDIAPTLLTCCDAAIPAHVQGYDLSAIWHGAADSPRQTVYIEGGVERSPEWEAVNRPMHHLPPDRWRALRTHDWLLATDQSGAVALLFDLATDPLGMENLAGRPEVARQEEALLARLRDEARALGDACLTTEH